MHYRRETLMSAVADLGVDYFLPRCALGHSIFLPPETRKTELSEQK